MLLEADLENFSQFTRLQDLNMQGCSQTFSVNDENFAKLSNLVALKRLNLYGSEITDTGMKSFSWFTNLEMLDLTGSPITSLVHISELFALKALNLSYTQYYSRKS